MQYKHPAGTRAAAAAKKSHWQNYLSSIYFVQFQRGGYLWQPLNAFVALAITFIAVVHNFYFCSVPTSVLSQSVTHTVGNALPSQFRIICDDSNECMCACSSFFCRHLSHVCRNGFGGLEWPHGSMFVQCAPPLFKPFDAYVFGIKRSWHVLRMLQNKILYAPAYTEFMTKFE